MPEGQRQWLRRRDSATAKKCLPEVARGDIRSAGFDLNGCWVPWYTMHKVMAGLRDSLPLCGNNLQALLVLTKLGDWADETTRNLNAEQMAENARLRARRHERGLGRPLRLTRAMSRYLNLSRASSTTRPMLDPLAARRDELPGKHANTQIPSWSALAARYELAGRGERPRGGRFLLGSRGQSPLLRDRWALHRRALRRAGQAERSSRPQARPRPATSTTCSSSPSMCSAGTRTPTWPTSTSAPCYNHILATQHPPTAASSTIFRSRPGGAQGIPGPVRRVHLLRRHRHGEPREIRREHLFPQPTTSCG